MFGTNPLGKAVGRDARGARLRWIPGEHGKGEKRGPQGAEGRPPPLPGAAPAPHLVEEGAVRHGDPQPAAAHAQHHVVRGVVAVTAALAAEQSPDGFPAEHHPAGGGAGALEPLLLGAPTPREARRTPALSVWVLGKAPRALCARGATLLGDAGRATGGAAALRTCSSGRAAPSGRRRRGWSPDPA